MGKKISVFVACLAGTMLLVVPGAMAAITVTDIEPSSGHAGATVNCAVTGTFYTGFLAGMPAFTLDDGVNPPIPGTTDGASLTATSVNVSFALPAAAPAVWYALDAVQNFGFWPGTDYSASLPHAFAVLPTISSLSPSSATAGDGELTLVVNGGNFVNSSLFVDGSSVRWNGAALDTTFNSVTRLTAIVPATKLTAAGTAEVTVMNVTAGTTSAPKTFTINALAPFLTTLSPTSVWAGYVKDDVVLTVNGGNFLTGAHIFLSGGEKTGTTFVNDAQLTVPLVAADISTPTTLTVSVKNPPFPPGVSSAGALPLVVAPETTDPAVTINGADAGWHNTAVPLTFNATDGQSGVQKVQYESTPTVAAWTDGTTYTVPVTTQGAIGVSARALDWCNRVGTAIATVNIDTTRPGTDARNAVSVKKGKTAKLKFRITEPADLSPTARVVIKIKAAKGGNTVKTKTLNGILMNSTQTYSFKATMKKGSYKWYVYATDLAGNTQANVDKAKFTVKRGGAPPGGRRTAEDGGGRRPDGRRPPPCVWALSSGPSSDRPWGKLAS